MISPPKTAKGVATVEAEREKKKHGKPSELMDLLIAYDWNENFRIPTRSPIDERSTNGHS